MKLFKVENGYVGFANVSVLVICKDKIEALKLARFKFKSIVDKEIEHNNMEIEECRNKFGNKFGNEFAYKLKKSLKLKYDETYYNNLSVKCLCDNVNKEWIGEIEE